MYRRLVKPYQQQMWQFIKARSGLPVFLHCCGGIYPLIPDLIEAGVDILNPVQISAVGMDPVRLKAEFGRDLVFWGGGADTQHVLPEATPGRLPTTCAGRSTSWRRAAGSSSTRCITSRPTSRRRTLSPCWTWRWRMVVMVGNVMLSGLTG